MMIVTTDNIPGKEVEAIGYVRGATVQSKHWGKDIASGFKTIVGGEIKAYTEMLEDARKEAVSRMVEEAKSLGADAITCLRFSSSSVMQGAAEVLAYGTAVKFK